MITLYAFGPYFGLPDPSPHVIKTELHLKMTGLRYQTVLGGLPISPKSKLPFIEDDGETIADSTFIREHLERKYGVDFDEGLEPADQAYAWAMERMVEDHLYWAMVHDRWMIDANFARGPIRFFDGAPEALRPTLIAQARDRVRLALHGQGLGRHSGEEIAALAARSLGAVSALIGEGPYLMGSRPCGSDAIVFGVLAGVLWPDFDSPVRQAGLRYPNLVRYCERMMEQWYPEYTRALTNNS
jgi:glutathione S-transferase